MYVIWLNVVLGFIAIRSTTGKLFLMEALPETFTECEQSLDSDNTRTQVLDCLYKTFGWNAFLVPGGLGIHKLCDKCSNCVTFLAPFNHTLLYQDLLGSGRHQIALHIDTSHMSHIIATYDYKITNFRP